MPFSPFFGVSILLHVAIITLYSIRGGRPLRAVRAAAKARVSYESYAIMAVIFLFVLASASWLVYASIRDSHSSLRVLGELLSPSHQISKAAPETP